MMINYSEGVELIKKVLCVILIWESVMIESSVQNCNKYGFII